MAQRRRQKRSRPGPDQTSQVVALSWLFLGVGAPLGYFAFAPSAELEKPMALVVIYVVSVLGLDLFVGASRRVALQRITPALVLALLVTPGIPPAVALVADLLGTVVVACSSRITWGLIAQAGKALLPSSLTALFLLTRAELDLRSYFFATEIFLLASLFTRTTKEPFRSDLFLVVSYPAIGLMLRSLAELHLAYVLLAVPLLFLMTTVDTEMLLRYFQLQQKLDHSQSEIQQSKRAQKLSEIESRHKGMLLTRKEQQLTLLNGLGREMDAAEATEDLGRFLLKECMRLIGSESSMILLSDDAAGRIKKIICPAPANYWGIKEGDRVPGLVSQGIRDREPWKAPVWRDRKSFLCSRLGNEGWMFLAAEAEDAFPKFLEDFFSAVGRHAGSAILALRRLTEVRALAQREALEKEKVATEKEKVAEQNRKLRLLIDNFEGLTEGALSSDHELLRQATLAVKRMSGADTVIFQSRDLVDYPQDDTGVLVEGTRWPSHLFVEGKGPSGNLLCLSRESQAFDQGQVEWCTLLKNFLDKTMENGALHREVQSSYVQLERTQEEVVLSSQWAAAGRLAANAAHELNTPLGAIRLAAEQAQFFLKPDSTPAPALQGLESIMRSVDRCRQVTDRLLITSRPVDVGDAPSEPTPQELMPILKEAVASVRPYLRASDITLADHRLMGNYQVNVVLQELYWAVVNLLKNGIDALNEGGPEKKQMAIAVAAAGDAVEVKIADNGPGVPEDLATRIFEPFFTTKKLGQGNGLGLALSRTNLRKWGGDLELADTPGGGATFILTIPLAQGSANR